MSRWSSQFNEHPIHATLKQLENWANIEFEEMTRSDLAERRRFLKIIAAYQDHLAHIDPELVPLNQVDSLNSVLSQPNQDIWNQLQAYSGDGDVQHLVIANDHISNQLTQLSLIIATSKKSRVEKPLRSLEKAVDKYAEKLSGQAEEFSSTVDELMATIGEQHEHIEALGDVIEKRKEETDSRLSEWQGQFSDAQDERSKEFSSLREKLAEEGRSQTTVLIEKEAAKLADNYKKFASKIAKQIEDATEKHERILELYGLVAGDSVAASYIENADKEGGQADFWRWASIIFIIATATWLGLAYKLNADAGVGGMINWPKLLTTISLTGVFLYGAAYSAQQSTRHRNNEKSTRRFALEVKAIDPFISSLNETDQSELKKNLSEKLFGHATDPGAPDGKIVDEHVLGTVLKSVADIIEKAKS